MARENEYLYFSYKKIKRGEQTLEKRSERTSGSWEKLKNFTYARVGLGRYGSSLPLSEELDFRLSHARAKDSVHSDLNFESLKEELKIYNQKVIILESEAKDRLTYLQRPDQGRSLSGESVKILEKEKNNYKLCITIADGLSALGVEKNAVNLIKELFLILEEWITISPICIVKQGRVAIGDEIGEALGAEACLVLIGERPGLKSPDSLGAYLTYSPRKGRTDAERNCVSNIRPEGLSIQDAARKLKYLITEMFARKITGVNLKDEALVE
jgi:ethanolamine ammonia-lyase small subunit